MDHKEKKKKPRSTSIPKKPTLGNKISNWFHKKKKNTSDKVLNHTEEYLADYLEAVPRKVLSPQEAIKIKHYEKLNSQQHLDKYLLPASPRSEEKNTTNPKSETKTLGKSSKIKKSPRKNSKSSPREQNTVPSNGEDPIESTTEDKITEGGSDNKTENGKEDPTTNNDKQNPIIDDKLKDESTSEVADSPLVERENTPIKTVVEYDIKQKSDLSNYYKIEKEIAKSKKKSKERKKFIKSFLQKKKKIHPFII